MNCINDLFNTTSLKDLELVKNKYQKFNPVEEYLYKIFYRDLKPKKPKKELRIFTVDMILEQYTADKDNIRRSKITQWHNGLHPYVTEGTVAIKYNGKDCYGGDIIIDKQIQEVKSTMNIGNDLTSFHPYKRDYVKDILLIGVNTISDYFEIFRVPWNLIENTYTAEGITLGQIQEENLRRKNNKIKGAKTRPRISVYQDIIMKYELTPEKIGYIDESLRSNS